jgi:hypothetical protein
VYRYGRLKLGPGGSGLWQPANSEEALAGYEATAMVRKGQVRNAGNWNMKAQVAFVAGLFGLAA